MTNSLADGARVDVKGSGSTHYTLAHDGEVFSCTCPAWRNQAVRIELRTCKHLRTYLGDEVETARVGTAAPPPRATAPKAPRAPKEPEPEPYVEDRELREEREEALQRALARLPVLQDRMQAVYGLRLPRHLAYAIGFLMGLSSEEREMISGSPCGVGAWFLDGALERKLKPKLDERLDHRYRCDPPEMVAIFTGGGDGEHHGLWYEDPEKLPNQLVVNYARDSAETWFDPGTTLLSVFDHRLREDPGTPADAATAKNRAAVLAWLEIVEPRARQAFIDDHGAPQLSRNTDILGGPPPNVPGAERPAWFKGSGSDNTRSAAYRENGPVVREQIANALAELDAGNAARALYLGRELHWLDADEYRAESTELLIRGYKAIGHLAFAEIVRVHHEHRDLESVDVFKRTLPTALPDAVEKNDVDATRAALAAMAPSEPELAAALQTNNTPVLDVLLDYIQQGPFAKNPADAARIVGAAALHHLEHALLARDVKARRAQTLRIWERFGATGRAFSYAVQSSDEALREAALRLANIQWRSTHGTSLLHVAVRIPSPDVVKTLLERGADPLARDANGKTPYDSAREIWAREARLIGVIFALLQSHGGGPPAKVVDKPSGWTVGATVVHKSFGDGVIEALEGKGDDTKLKIRFGVGTKTLQAKFVTAK